MAFFHPADYKCAATGGGGGSATLLHTAYGQGKLWARLCFLWDLVKINFKQQEE